MTNGKAVYVLTIQDLPCPTIRLVPDPTSKLHKLLWLAFQISDPIQEPTTAQTTAAAKKMVLVIRTDALVSIHRMVHPEIALLETMRTAVVLVSAAILMALVMPTAAKESMENAPRATITVAHAAMLAAT